MGKKLLLVIPAILLTGSLYAFRDTILVEKPVIEQSEATASTVEREDGIDFDNPKPANPDELHYFVNEERKERGLSELKRDLQLDASAEKKLAQLETEGWGAEPHVDNNGVRGHEYIIEATQDSQHCTAVSENLSQNGYGAKNVVYSWMTSTTGHREALLNVDYDIVGYAGNDNYAVQHFCDLD